MATREGIYVGDKDIVERYVGDKLVWSKWVYVGYYQNLRTPYYSQGYLIFNPIDLGNFNDNYRDMSRVKDVKVQIQHRNDTITTVYAKYAQLYTRNTGEDNYSTGKSLYISFKDDNQRQVFENNFSNGDSLFFYFR